MATENGFLYVYDISEVEGGDCKLVIKHDLRNVDTQPIRIQGKPTEKLSGKLTNYLYKTESIHID